MKKQLKKLNPVDRLLASMEKRLTTYRKNKERINAQFKEALAKEDRKISDLLLQIKALKKK